MDRAPPYVTSKSWAVFDASTEKFLFGKFESERWEVASLTKLMVAYTVISICQRFDIDMESHLIEVSYDSTEVSGTSAKLREGDYLSIK